MKYLLTSGGVRNARIREALESLLGRPPNACRALCIPTALYGHPQGTPEGAWRFVNGRSGCPMVELGWRSVGLLELTALPSLPPARWQRWVHEADVLLAEGGDAAYLCHWMRESGLAALLPSLERQVWVGLSAGSLVMTPRFGDAFLETKPPITGDDRGLGQVAFSIFPHLDHPGFDENTMACAERWAATIGGPAYAIDDETAIVVDGDRVEVVSEGHWRRFGG